MLAQAWDSEPAVARTEEKGWRRWELGTEKPLRGTLGADLGRRRGRDEPQPLLAKIPLESLPTRPPRGAGAGPKGPLCPSWRCSPPEPGRPGGRAAGGEGKVSPGWPQAPLTVTVSRPRNPCMLPVPYWMDRGLFRFWKVEDLAGSKR